MKPNSSLLNTDPDILLYQQLIQGRKDAFDALFRKYYQTLCRFAYLYTGDRDESEEAVQTAFISLWEGRNSIAITRSLKAYLYQMVRNNALMFLRKVNTRKQYEQQYLDLHADELISERTLSDNEINDLVRKGLNMLPEKCRVIFSLSRYDGLTYEEIAEYLEISPKTVENQMGIAFQKLREYLVPVWKKLLIILGVLFGGSIT
ncbi:MAG: RNA polymerase sigma-70 factor [Bacteroidales bacterium]|nr:RNA polymerase sigma-70 factor [Bacteroidales bacterium]